MIIARVWRNERYSGREREREGREEGRKREREGERVPEPDGKAGREEARATNVKERNTVQRRKRREWARGEKERRERRAGGGKRTWNEEGEESGPFDGAFVGSRGALRFATKIVALPGPRVRRSAPRRVICCEFINATIARDDRARVAP